MRDNRSDRPFRAAMIDVLNDDKDGKPRWQYLLETLDEIVKQEGRKQ